MALVVLTAEFRLFRRTFVGVVYRRSFSVDSDTRKLITKGQRCMINVYDASAGPLTCFVIA